MAELHTLPLGEGAEEGIGDLIILERARVSLGWHMNHDHTDMGSIPPSCAGRALLAGGVGAFT
jgi:hypothetical protein